MLPVKNLIALALNRFHARSGASLNETGGTALKSSQNCSQLTQRMSQVILHGRPLAREQVFIIGEGLLISAPCTGRI
jgi:hypothetical protein